MNFDVEYNKIKSLFTGELDIIKDDLVAEIDLREPLNTNLKQFLLSPSKNIRAILSLLYLKANNKIIDKKVLKLLGIVELIHNASLIHDDIIDESDLRRGAKTINYQFSSKIAVLSGDYLLSVAMQNLLELKNNEITNIFLTTIKQMCLGEINQNFDRFKTVTLDRYIEKTKQKTAGLFEATLTSAAIICASDIKRAKDFALNFGMAFQLRDDIMNFKADDNSKPVNNDIKMGIYNAPVILGDKSDNYSSGIEKSTVLLNNYVDKGKKIISDLPKSLYKSALIKLLELISYV